ncbi:hypothetical protein E2C01_023299 [Portunus trituberculatus]|uniref:Uncharacterized protein n=1 Tax=Portunus trituberculatus TaxID=210409 RepID=A0A5B7E9N1_PORTR|nr:hypothetical protein [Portunus trituberculatus]
MSSVAATRTTANSVSARLALAAVFMTYGLPATQPYNTSQAASLYPRLSVRQDQVLPRCVKS